MEKIFKRRMLKGKLSLLLTLVMVLSILPVVNPVKVQAETNAETVYDYGLYLTCDGKVKKLINSADGSGVSVGGDITETVKELGLYVDSNNSPTKGRCYWIMDNFNFTTTCCYAIEIEDPDASNSIADKDASDCKSYMHFTIKGDNKIITKSTGPNSTAFFGNTMEEPGECTWASDVTFEGTTGSKLYMEAGYNVLEESLIHLKNGDFTFAESFCGYTKGGVGIFPQNALEILNSTVTVKTIGESAGIFVGLSANGGRGHLRNYSIKDSTILIDASNTDGLDCFKGVIVGNYAELNVDNSNITIKAGRLKENPTGRNGIMATDDINKLVLSNGSSMIMENTKDDYLYGMYLSDATQIIVKDTSKIQMTGKAYYENDIKTIFEACDIYDTETWEKAERTRYKSKGDTDPEIPAGDYLYTDNNHKVAGYYYETESGNDKMEIYAKHTHNWEGYRVKAGTTDTIERICTGEGGRCYYEKYGVVENSGKKEKTATLTLKGDDLTYTGKAQLPVDKQQYNNWVRETGDTPAFTYTYSSTQDGTYTEVTEANDAGFYKVVCLPTSGAVTANKEFKINKIDATADDFTFTTPSAMSSVYTGNGIEPTITTRAATETEPAVAGMGDITYKYYKVVNGNETYLGDGVKPTDVGTYKVKIDVAEGQNYLAANELTKDDWTFAITRASQSAPGTTEGYTLSYQDETLIAADNYEVSLLDGDAATALANNKVVPGNTYYVRKKADNNHDASPWTSIVLAVRQTTPDASDYEIITPSAIGAGNGTLKNIADCDLEYSLDNGKNWNNLPDQYEVTTLSAGTRILLRKQATVSAFKSDNLEVTIPAHTHKGEKVDGKAATCTETGWHDYYRCSCGIYFSNADCTSAIGNVTVIEEWKTSQTGKIPALGHDLTYACVGTDQIKASCQNAGCTESATLTLTAGDSTYTGNVNPATISDAEKSAWTVLVKTSIPTITYEYRTNSEGTYAAVTDTKNAGYYKASITAKGQTATKEYTISKAIYSGVKTSSTNLKKTNGSTAVVTLPSIPAGASYGAIDNSANTGVFTVGTIGADGKVTITAESGVESLAVSKEFIVPVSGATNYSDYNITVTVTPTDLATQSIEASDVSATYGDTGKKVNAAASTTLSYEVEIGTDVVAVNRTTGELTIRKAGSAVVTVTAAESETYAGATKDVNINISRANQAAPNVTAVAPTSSEATDGKVTGVTSAMEYSTDGGNTWTSVVESQTSITGLAAGTTVKVRLKGDDNHFDGEKKTVTVPEYKAPSGGGSSSQEPSGSDGGGGTYTGGGDSSGGGATGGGTGEAGDKNQTTETIKNPDGSTTEKTKETNADGSTVVTEKTTGKDGSVTEKETTKATDGSVTEKETTRAADGTVTESEKVTAKDGRVTEKSTTTEADGTVTETKRVEAANGKVTEKSVETKPDGTVTETAKTEAVNGKVTERVTVTEPDGAVVETKTTTKVDGSKVTNVTNTSADGKEETSVAVSYKADGTVAKATVEVAKEVEGKKLTVSTADLKEMVSDAGAGKKNTEITLTAKDESGKEKFSVSIDPKNLTNKSLVVYTLDKKGNLVMVDTSKNTAKVGKDGDLDLNISGKGDFTIISSTEAAKIDKAILKTVEPAKKEASVAEGKKTTFKLSSDCNKKNIATITYKADNKNVKVDKNGKITANSSGTTTVTATITLKNGKTKTVKMKIKVK